ncbi:MAG TPA: epoxyqueuosine reductase QueH [bacterium]|nr:epoxyqueuosine reductase QueH [bacterium]
MGKMKTLLLHTCCAPCVTVPLQRLQADFDVTCYYYNPNIHPIEEYQKRLAELQRFSDEMGISLIVEHYDPDNWFEQVKGLEPEPEGGQRCAVCFAMRLGRTAAQAQAVGFHAFTTTMSISPHKNSELLNQLGKQAAEKNSVEYVIANFKKQDGFRKSNELSRRYNFYRQNYCGCIFSQR